MDNKTVIDNNKKVVAEALTSANAVTAKSVVSAINFTLTGREIARLRMHATSHVQDIGNLGPFLELVDKVNRNNKIATLVKVDGGVLGKSNLGNEFFIPDGNIVTIEFKKDK